MDTSSCNSYEQNHASYDHHDYDDDDDDQEESGWGTILEDYSNQYRTTYDQDKSSCSILDGSPSMVSDAATNAFSGQDFPAKLKFGKTRSKKICDDDLEDTASSPVNSPKVSHIEQIQTPPRKIDDHVSSSFLMRNMKSMENHQIKIQEGGDEPKMDLRSKGLCVFPISELAKFNGRF